MHPVGVLLPPCRHSTSIPAPATPLPLPAFLQTLSRQILSPDTSQRYSQETAHFRPSSSHFRTPSLLSRGFHFRGVAGLALCPSCGFYRGSAAFARRFSLLDSLGG